VDRVCTRCGVAVPQSVFEWPRFTWTYDAPPLADHVGPYADYARTKDDKR
jgi:hypothetical protein